MKKTKKKFLNYLIKELKWPKNIAEDWCNYLLYTSQLIEDEKSKS